MERPRDRVAAAALGSAHLESLQFLPPLVVLASLGYTSPRESRPLMTPAPLAAAFSRLPPPRYGRLLTIPSVPPGTQPSDSSPRGPPDLRLPLQGRPGRHPHLTPAPPKDAHATGLFADPLAKMESKAAPGTRAAPRGAGVGRHLTERRRRGLQRKKRPHDGNSKRDRLRRPPAGRRDAGIP